jgi:hypothetical protein
MLIIMPTANPTINQRHAALQRYLQLKPEIGAAKAARAVGASVATIWRWQRAYDAQGIQGLQTKYHHCGRRSPIAGVHFTIKALRQVEQLILKTGSVRAAWRQFATQPDCPPAVARLVTGRKHLPKSLARLVQLKPLPARCLMSADGRRVFVKLSARGTATAQPEAGE